MRKQKKFIRACFLIDVDPKRFRGGGQMHLAALRREMRVQSSKLKVQSFGGPSPNTLARFLWMILVIPQLIYHHYFIDKFDLIHAHSVPAIVVGKIISILLRLPVVVTVHGFNDQRRLEKFVLTQIKFDAQISVSRNFLKEKNVNRAVYIPNGVDLGRFAPNSKFNPPAGGQNSKLKIVLFVGRKTDPIKGFKYLEEAMKIVRRKLPEVRLIIMGGDRNERDVISAYRKADLLVIPSLSEGFPLVLLEAWSMGLPVVATAVGELKYLIKEGANGYLVEPGNADALSRKILTALRNPHSDEVGAEGRKLAAEFSWVACAKNTVKIYAGVLEKQTRSWEQKR